MQPVLGDPDDNALLTERQAAAILNLSIRTLQAWRTNRHGPSFVRAGRAVRYRRRDLYAWTDLNTVCFTRSNAVSRRAT